MKHRFLKFFLIRLLLLYFILLLSEKVCFTAKVFNIHIIYVELTCMEMCAEPYLEPGQTSMVELL